ncbi:MAG: hypothetical protein ACLGIJ_06050 [Candidatus Limnocylindria bacterium]
MPDVAREPSAWSELQIPLLPLEIAMVTQRTAAAVDTTRALEAYGSAIPDEYGGACLDDGTAVLLMTVGVPQHTAAIERLLPGRRIEVRPVEYALTELNDRAEQVRWLSLDRVGAPARSGPIGALRPRLLDRIGRPIAGECFLQPLEEGVSFDVLPREIDGRGIYDFEQRVPASRYRLEITYDEGRESRRFITEIRVVGGATMEEVIVIDQEFAVTGGAGTAARLARCTQTSLPAWTGSPRISARPRPPHPVPSCAWRPPGVARPRPWWPASPG